MKLFKRLLFSLALTCLAAPTVFAAPQADWPKQLNFGVIPVESSDNVTDRFGNLAQYLEKQLGIPVKLQTATDYAGVIAAMQFKHIDLAYFGPKSYVEAAQRANAEAFVIETALDGSKGYHGLIITKADSPIKSLEDAKGKIWAFTDPNSTSGTLVPTVYFVKEMKIKPEEYFSRVVYSGSHQASILEVKSGRIDLASTNDLDLLRGDGKQWDAKKDFRILWTSPLIPSSPMAYRKDLPESLKKALTDAFVAYDDKKGLDLLKVSGYQPATDDVFDPIREQIEVKKQLDAN